jgi:Protein of unknown function (DUF1579)
MRFGKTVGQLALAILVVLAAVKISTSTLAKSEKRTGQEAAVKPALEMDRLQKLYVGTWDYTETYAKTPSAPKGGSDTGVYTSELGPGGNSIMNRFHSKGAVGDFDGLLVMTWDPRESAYKSYVFGNDFPGCIVQTGHFDGDTLEYRTEIDMGGMKLKLRNVTRFLAPGKIVSEEYMTAGDAPEKLFVSVEAKKRAQ